jgi:hypothetical protein
MKPLPIPFETIQEISMKTKLALSAVVAAIAVFSQGAFAQASAPVTRAEVKAQAKSGSLAPAGEGPGAMASQPSKASDKTRMERKDQTKADAKSGKLAPAGEGPGAMGSQPSKASDKTRMERKDQTKADIKAGATQPAGEAANPIAVPPKK